MKIEKIKIILIMTLFFMPFSFLYSENKKETVDITKTDEFKNMLNQAVEKRMKRFGKNNMIEISKELLVKDEKLKLRELELSKKEESLKYLEGNLTKQLKGLQQRQENFLACADNIERKKEERITHMVEVIAGMKPDKSANVLSVQDPAISVRILGLLEPVKVSKIFNLMDKEVSARLQKQYMTMQK